MVPSSLLNQIGGEGFIYVLVLVFVAFILMTFVDSIRKGRRLRIEPPNAQTELVCPSCGLKEVRPYKDGDFIGKNPDDSCKSCGHTLSIKGIYAQAPKKASAG
ncbi:MAG: hypothetical protein ACE5KH_06755 [Candidatus Geothermarchaeales archaeon]